MSVHTLPNCRALCTDLASTFANACRSCPRVFSTVRSALLSMVVHCCAEIRLHAAITTSLFVVVVSLSS